MDGTQQFHSFNEVQSQVQQLTCVFPQVLHSFSHVIMLLAVEEIWSLVWALPGSAALGVAYHFRILMGLVGSALVSSRFLQSRKIMQAVSSPSFSVLILGLLLYFLLVWQYLGPQLKALLTELSCCMECTLLRKINEGLFLESSCLVIIFSSSARHVLWER